MKQSSEHKDWYSSIEYPQSGTLGDLASGSLSQVTGPNPSTQGFADGIKIVVKSDNSVPDADRVSGSPAQYHPDGTVVSTRSYGMASAPSSTSQRDFTRVSGRGR